MRGKIETVNLTAVRLQRLEVVGVRNNTNANNNGVWVVFKDTASGGTFAAWWKSWSAACAYDVTPKDGQDAEALAYTAWCAEARLASGPALCARIAKLAKVDGIYDAADNLWVPAEQ